MGTVDGELFAEVHGSPWHLKHSADRSVFTEPLTPSSP